MAVTIHIAYFRLVLDGARRLGLDTDEVARRAEIDPSELEGLNARLPLEVGQRMWQAIVDLADDTTVGLRLARLAQGASVGVLEYAARNCPTVGEVLRTLAEYIRLINTAASLKVTDEGDRLALTYRLSEGPSAHPASTDFTLAYMMYRLCAISGRNVRPSAVDLLRAQPDDPSALYEAFGPRIRWSRAVIRVYFTPSQWAVPVEDIDTELGRLMRSIVARQIGDLPASDDICAEIKAELVHATDGSTPSLAQMATRLGLSARSLQRRLEQAGTTYRALSTKVRLAWAADLLTAGQLALAQVASMVGFSEPSAFHRAFRRVYGVTPTQYRRAHRA